MKLLLILVLGTSWVYSQPAENATFSCKFDDSLLTHSTSKEVRGAHEYMPAFKWEKGEIPYYFKNQVPENDKAVIRRAMKEIEEHNDCFHFVEKNNYNGHRLAIIVLQQGSCWSNGFTGEVTAQYYSTEVTLTSYWRLTDNPECNHKDGIVHELMHALGVSHTQRRKDRNDYITVITNNINQTAIDQYDPCKDCDDLGVEYDCASIMHYGTGTFSIGGRPTMKAIDSNSCKLSWQGAAGDGRGASAADWKLLEKIGNKVC